MKTLLFNVDINASREKVWNALWNDKNYRTWTSVFQEGSHAVSNWNEGDRIIFQATDGEGMYSVIDKKIDQEYMSFKHLGMMKNGQEQPEDEISKAWTGAKENYRLHDTGKSTRLEVQLDTTEESEKYFAEKFPVALSKVKEIAEG